MTNVKKAAGMKLMREYQAMKAKAYSNISLKRSLSPTEFEEYKSAFAYAYPAAFKKVFPHSKKPKMRL